jgi:hypothetical protein
MVLNVVISIVLPSIECHTPNAQYSRVFQENYLRPMARQKRLNFSTGALPLALRDSALCHVARPVQDLVEIRNSGTFSALPEHESLRFWSVPKYEAIFRS